MFKDSDDNRKESSKYIFKELLQKEEPERGMSEKWQMVWRTMGWHVGLQSVKEDYEDAYRELCD